MLETLHALREEQEDGWFRTWCGGAMRSGRYVMEAARFRSERQHWGRTSAAGNPLCEGCDIALRQDAAADEG